MTEEQNVQQGGKCKVLVTLVIISLLFSIASLAVSVLTATGNMPGVAAGGDHGKVVISKQYDKGRNLDKALKTGKPIIVFFYTDWCGFCQRFAPTFDKITKDKRIKKNFAIAFVNCEDQNNSAHVQEYGIQGFPTVFVVKKDGSRTQLDNNTFFNDDSKTVVADKAMELIAE